MPICIECGWKLANLYTTYSKADDRSLGKGVKLTQCPRCKKFADKYVEHDYVVIFIDLVLIKPQVYRHLLFNRLGRDDDTFHPSIIRLGVLLLLFDVYLTWARIEKAIHPSSSTNGVYTPTNTTNPSSSSSPSNGVSSTIPPNYQTLSTFLTTQSIMTQYVFFLTLCFGEMLAFHLPVRWLLSAFPSSQSSSSTSLHHDGKDEVNRRSWIPYYPHPSLVSSALLMSSFTKLFPLLLLIWSYDLPSSASAVNWAVIINNIAALKILLDCSILHAVGLAAVGASCRALMGCLVLASVGVKGGWSGVVGSYNSESTLAWRAILDAVMG